MIAMNFESQGSNQDPYRPLGSHIVQENLMFRRALAYRTALIVLWFHSTMPFPLDLLAQRKSIQTFHSLHKR